MEGEGVDPTSSWSRVKGIDSIKDHELRLRALGSRFRGSGVGFQGFQVSGSKVSGSKVPGLKVSGLKVSGSTGFKVSGCRIGACSVQLEGFRVQGVKADLERAPGADGHVDVRDHPAVLCVEERELTKQLAFDLGRQLCVDRAKLLRCSQTLETRQHLGGVKGQGSGAEGEGK